MMRGEVWPSQRGGIPPSGQRPAKRSARAGAMAAGSVPTRRFVPMVQVSGRSVLSRRVRQGTCMTVVSSVMPPESVTTAIECLTSQLNSR